MKRLAIGLLFAATALAADPELLRLAMPDARILSGVDVAKVKGTPFGKFAAQQFTAAQDPQYDAFVKASGFDPLENLLEIVMAKPDAGDTWLVLARGKFDTARILEAAAAAGAGVATFQGSQVLISPETWLVFLTPSVAAMGDPASVRALVARRDKSSGPAAEIASRADVVSKSHGVWFLSTVPIAELMRNVPSGQAGDVLKGGLSSVTSASGGINFGDSVRVSGKLVAATAADASRLAAALKFLSGVVLQSPADVSAEGSTVSLGVSLTEAKLEALWKQSK